MSLEIGSWPIEAGQWVWVTYRVDGPGGRKQEGTAEALWQRNEGANSYWRACIGPFDRGERVTYAVQARSSAGVAIATGFPSGAFRVGPGLHLALLWHQHQPLYRDLSARSPRGSFLQPWVRLHGIRDYYSMAALAAEHPGVHLTINLTPALLRQIDDYLDGGATDRALELTLKPAEQLSGEERRQVLSGFFDAHWHNQILVHSRYRELFVRRREGRGFGAEELRDLQMWFSLAWFAKEFREGDVPLATGEIASVRRFVEQARGFAVSDIEAMVAEQYKILRAVVPLHRDLQERGQIEVSTTPFDHPILPLLIDTDRATIDRPGARHPRRFARPEDAEAQVVRAVQAYRKWFGSPPRGMWPAEGAVSEPMIPLLARHGVQWIATDRGVLARSGRWGYDADDPDVLCRPYRAEADGAAVSVFFRDSGLADRIGFHYQAYGDHEEAAREFLAQIRERFARRLGTEDDRVLAVALDGENAWGAYRDDARPFLHALYGLLERDPEIESVTFSEYLDGNPPRGIGQHPRGEQLRVHDLFTGSWIDETGSDPGVDLGTWIGEEEENRAWELLGETRDAVEAAGATADTAPLAFEALYAAEGSDWFWWLGDDHDSGNDEEFDDLFRLHLRNVYRSLGRRPPVALRRHIVPHAVLWTFTKPVRRVQPGDLLTIRTHCPGRLAWRMDEGEERQDELLPAGGVMAGVRRYHLTLAPLPAAAREVRFRFRCGHAGCCDEACRSEEERLVEIG